MISKSSFFSLGKENVNHRIGVFSIALLCFAGHLIMFVMSVQSIYLIDKNEKFSALLESITELSYPSLELGVIAGFAGTLLALSAFHFLHSRQQVDFYDALPIRRRQTMFLLMTVDLILFCFAMFVTLALQCVVVACIGCLTKEFLIYSAFAFICYLVVFFAIYLLMVLAMLMTGNVLTSLLGFGVLSAYFPLLIKNIYPLLAVTFFKTYCSDSSWGEKLEYLSPVSTAYELVRDYDKWTWMRHRGAFLILCLWILLLLAADFWLYERRPAETVGKSMAFPKMKPVIRVFLVMPLAVYAGIILYTMAGRERREWIVVGLVLGTMFFHGIIECIYRFDARGAWAHKRQMLLTMCASFLLVGYFWLDMGKYDEYIPSASEVETVLINPPFMGMDEEYGYWGRDRKGVSGATMEHALAILEEVIRNNDENYRKITDFDEAEDSETVEYYYIRYRLKNGQEKLRCYALDKELQNALLGAVYDDEQYRRDTYSLYSADWSWITTVGLYSPVEYNELDLTKEQKSELFQIYLEEFSKLDYNTATRMLPCGQFSIDHRIRNDVYGDYVDYYTIYPTFKKTISYLRDELNIDMKTSLNEIEIHKLQMSEYGETETVYTVEDKKTIEALKSSMCYGIDFWETGILLKEPLLTDSVSAYIRTDQGMEEEILSITEEGAELLKKNGEKTVEKTVEE